MKRPIRRACLIAGPLALTWGQAGCHQTPKTDSAMSYSKPTDPTAWSDKDLARSDGEAGSTKSGLTRSSRLSGGLSSEARDIESSLGVGGR